VLVGEQAGVAIVEAGGLVELGVAFGGGVVAQADDALTPGARLGQRGAMWVGWAQLTMK